MRLGFTAPATALAAALLMPAGMTLLPASASSPVQLAAALTPSQPPPGATKEKTQPRGTMDPSQPQAPVGALNNNTPSKNGTPRPAPASPGTAAPLHTLNQTPSTPKEGIHGTPSSPSTGQDQPKPKPTVRQ